MPKGRKKKKQQKLARRLKEQLEGREVCYLRNPCDGDCSGCRFYASLSSVIGKGELNA